MIVLQVSASEKENILARANRRVALDQLQEIRLDTAAFRTMRQQKLVKDGLELIDDDACPLCDTVWVADDLREYLRQKLANAESFGEQLNGRTDQAQAIINAIAVRVSQLGRVASYCSQIQPKIDARKLVERVETLAVLSDGLADFVADQTNLEKAISAFSAEWWALTDQEAACVVACRAALEALPSISPEDQVKHDLSIAQERYHKSVEATRNGRTALQRKKRADAVLNAFNISVTNVLEGIYTALANDFTRFYRAINREDEGSFKAKLAFPTPARLSLNVDFFGRGLFPPGAYHSEGHQDGMGLCLYLALMKRTLGEKFTFAVLDDVVMSVDAGHRRELCRLLKTEFPYTQFVLTTHDRVWLQYMRSEGLIERSQTFGGWSVDSGPRIWDDCDVWQEIEGELAKGNVPTAAHYLRRYLEHVAFGLADGLRARLGFRGDGQYDLGDLLPSALSRWQEILKTALKVAQRWKQSDAITRITALADKTKDAVTQSNVERWAINRAVHFTEWENLQSDEFRSVVRAFREVVQVVRCSQCNSSAYLSPRVGPSEVVKCTCGELTINLVDRQRRLAAW